MRELFGTVCTFNVGCQHYIAIEQDCWDNNRNELTLDQCILDRVAGRIIILGKCHVVLDCAPEREPAGGAGPSISEILTRREMQVAILVSEGGGDKDIARKLGISSYTVREHMRRIFNKLGVSKRTAVVTRVLISPYRNFVLCVQAAASTCFWGPAAEATSPFLYLYI
jgi:DNA-binding CsgD family transcriptional regulator